MDSKINAFIFDLDGTLLDTVPDLTLLTNRILKTLGYPEHTQAEILSYVGSGVRRLIYLALPPDAPEDKVEEAVELWQQHFSEYYEHSLPYPGIEDLLDKLKARGDSVAVVSNKLQEGVNDVLAKMLPGRFDVAYGEGPGIPRKPDPTGIETAMKKIGATPSTTLYTGDSPGDIRAGRNAGCKTAAALWGYHKKQDFIDEDAIPDIWAEHPLDLLAFSK